jgi:hypothetical protein
MENDYDIKYLIDKFKEHSKLYEQTAKKRPETKGYENFNLGEALMIMCVEIDKLKDKNGK